MSCVLILEWRWKRLDSVTRAFVANTTKLVSCASGYCRVLKSANPCVKHVGLMEDEGSELKDPKWTGDVVSKFLQSPVYSVPLLDFIDDNCSVFKDCNESNLECTIVRSNYMHYIVKPLQRTSIGPYRCHLLWWNENVVDSVGRCILKSTSIISSNQKQIVHRTCLLTMWMAMLAGAREFQAARGCSLIGFLVRFGNSYARLCPNDSQVRTYALKDNLSSPSWNSKRFHCSESGTLTTEKAWHCDCYYFTSCPNRDSHIWYFFVLDRKVVDAFGRPFCIVSSRLLQCFVPNWQTDGNQSGCCRLACQPRHGNLLYIFRDGCKKLPEFYLFYLQPGAFVTVQHRRNCHPDSRRLLPFQGIPLPHRPENP